MAVHGIIHYMVYTNLNKLAGRDIVKRYINYLKKESESGVM
jgi:hypothetical protein